MDKINYGIIGLKSARPAKIVPQKTKTIFNDEGELQAHIIKWFKKEYPGVHFRTDWFAGHYCPPYVKEQFNNAQSGSGYPDMHFIHRTEHYTALYIETKLNTVFRQDGITLLYSQHLWDQYEYITYLRKQGCAALFGCGEENIKRIIADYMAGGLVEQNIIAKPYISKADEAVNQSALEFQERYDNLNK